MKISLFNVDEFCKNLPEITSTEELKKGDYHSEGLFSKQIFGPESTAVCGCGIYWGRTHIGQKCPDCGVEITYANERKKRFAKIKLPFKIPNPTMIYLIAKIGKMTIKTILFDILCNNDCYGYYYFEDKFTRISTNDIEDENFEIPEGATVYSGFDSVYDIVNDLCLLYKDSSKDWSFVYENLDKFYMENIIVIPPDYRPACKHKDSKKIDELNREYRYILNKNVNWIKKYSLEDETNKMIIEFNKKYFFNQVLQLFDYVYDMLPKKKGLIRRYILGKRLDFSGRAVITPDPFLNIDQCSIPYVMALELYKLDLAQLFLIKRLYNRLDRALNEIDLCIEEENFKYYDIVNKWLIDHKKNIILNRQPTLHRLGILSFEVKLNKDNVIKIHPFVCEGYNADYDGDQMAVYRPLYDDAEKECEEKLSIDNNLISPATSDTSIGINQDVVYGLYVLTKEGMTEKTNYVKKGKKYETYKGRIKFNQILPKDYDFINMTINKKTLKVLINDLIRNYDTDTIKRVLDDIKRLGFLYTTIYGCTMSLGDIDIKECIKIRDEIYEQDITWAEKLMKLKSDEIKEKIRPYFPYADFIDSGSRGSWDQAAQLILTRGYVSNYKGNIIETPIKSNLMEGMNKKEFFISCYGQRKGLLDTAINTGDSGYLTRKLIYCTGNLELDPNLDDCGTNDYLEIDPNNEIIKNVNQKMLMRSLIGRFIKYKDKEYQITYFNYNDFVGKKIYLRSPIFCKSYHLCKKCYGEIHNLHSRYIGNIAAQSLGEVATQLVLRTFHISGSANVANKDTQKNKDIISGLTKVNKIFKNTIGYNYYRSLFELFNIFSDYKILLLTHFECIISQMMRRDKKRWRIFEDRDFSNMTFTSIEAVPEQESLLLGIAFSKPKYYLFEAVLSNDQYTDGYLEKIMTNKNI